MIKTVLVFFLLAISAQAGMLRVLTFVPRHPVQSAKGFAKGAVVVAKIGTYWVRHPVKTFVQDTPVYRLGGITWTVPTHGPTLPPKPWADSVIVKVEGEF